MNLPPRDYTDQENIIAECLSEFGMRYTEQYEFFPYTVDFLIPDLDMVIEADGKYGHLRKRDRKRDLFLLGQNEVQYIVHIKETTKVKIKDALWQELNKLPPVANPE
jgi:very-short-patch-repair endonuclease|tara:strand:+ start:363 stop:683 length:321 start_codon:yes stop_codon:yes gene_type:complete